MLWGMSEMMKMGVGCDVVKWDDYRVYDDGLWMKDWLVMWYFLVFEVDFCLWC